MKRLFVPLAFLLALPIGRAATPEPSQLSVKEKEAIELRFQHREARIREALAHGDLTEAEAESLRHRLERKRESLLKCGGVEPHARPKPPHPVHPKLPVDPAPQVEAQPAAPIPTPTPD
ncbi:hypothetical protein ACUHMQ_05525 [Chitinimonas sp. PSY-7]|uniref:hypothetical protein n=1 Tax=Chitinimonas sp. PSY-7 TaxID=3459088 RepID=UPI00404014A1